MESWRNREHECAGGDNSVDYDWGCSFSYLQSNSKDQKNKRSKEQQRLEIQFIFIVDIVFLFLDSTISYYSLFTNYIRKNYAFSKIPISMEMVVPGNFSSCSNWRVFCFSDFETVQQSNCRGYRDC